MIDEIDRYEKIDNNSHIICTKCGKIDDYFNSFDIKVPYVDNYKLVDYDLYFNGVCNDCLKEENKYGIKRK